MLYATRALWWRRIQAHTTLFQTSSLTKFTVGERWSAQRLFVCPHCTESFAPLLYRGAPVVTVCSILDHKFAMFGFNARRRLPYQCGRIPYLAWSPGRLNAQCQLTYRTYSTSSHEWSTLPLEIGRLYLQERASYRHTNAHLNDTASFLRWQTLALENENFGTRMTSYHYSF